MIAGDTVDGRNLLSESHPGSFQHSCESSSLYEESKVPGTQDMQTTLQPLYDWLLSIVITSAAF